MKKILKYTLLFTFAIVSQNLFWQNFEFGQSISTIIKVALIVTLFELFLKPVIKILLLPINILTLGLFRLIINTIGLYLAVFLIGDFTISNINLPAQNLLSFNLPPIQLTGFFVYLVNSLSTNLFFDFFKFIIKSNKPNKK